MIGVGFVGALETLTFKVGAHKGFDQPRPRRVFLQDSVEPIQFLLHRAEQWFHLHHKNNDDDRSDQQKRQHAERQVAAGIDHQDETANHQQGRACADPQRDLRHALDGGRIAGQAHHQLTCLLFVEIAVGKSLDAREERVSQVAGDTFPDLHRQNIITDRDQRADNGNTNHQQGSLNHHLLVVGCDALVNDALNQTRDGEVEEYQRGQQDQRRNGAFPVWTDKMEEFENLIHVYSISA